MRNVLRLSDDDIKEMEKGINGEVKSGEIDDPKEVEKPKQSPVNQAPEKLVDKEKEEEKPKPEPEKKEERYVPSHSDELAEELTRYIQNINEQD